jgi:hypothetical protein
MRRDYYVMFGGVLGLRIEDRTRVRSLRGSIMGYQGTVFYAAPFYGPRSEWQMSGHSRELFRLLRSKPDFWSPESSS